MRTALQELIERAIAERFDGKATKLAEAIHISDGTLSKVRSQGKNLDWDTLLRLAIAIGRPASDVLRLAGKGELATLIEACYGAPQEVPPDAREAVDILRQRPDLASLVLEMLRKAAASIPNPAHTERPRSANPGTGAERPRARGAARVKAR